ncbi:hypothetical protein protein [Bacillus cereus G9241]|nr:hypothetical protein protein [Bacillus cereus G9241]
MLKQEKGRRVYIGVLRYAGQPFSLFCTFLLCMIFGGECKKAYD